MPNYAAWQSAWIADDFSVKSPKLVTFLNGFKKRDGSFQKKSVLELLA